MVHNHYLKNISYSTGRNPQGKNLKTAQIKIGIHTNSATNHWARIELVLSGHCRPVDFVRFCTSNRVTCTLAKYNTMHPQMLYYSVITHCYTTAQGVDK